MVAKSESIDYISLREIQDNPDYEAGMGTMIEGDCCQGHTIEHSGVAKYPGDKGMKYIGQKICDDK